MNFNELAKKAFENAKAKGFHDEKHTEAHWIMLVACELAEAVTDDPCEGCSLQNEKGLVCRGDVGVTGLCYDGMRRDNKQVVFKEVSENEKPLESLLNGDFTGETSEEWV